MSSVPPPLSFLSVSPSHSFLFQILVVWQTQREEEETRQGWRGFLIPLKFCRHHLLFSTYSIESFFSLSRVNVLPHASFYPNLLITLSSLIMSKDFRDDDELKMKIRNKTSASWRSQKSVLGIKDFYISLNRSVLGIFRPFQRKIPKFLPEEVSLKASWKIHGRSTCCCWRCLTLKVGS